MFSDNLIRESMKKHNFVSIEAQISVQGTENEIAICNCAEEHYNSLAAGENMTIVRLSDIFYALKVAEKSRTLYFTSN